MNPDGTETVVIGKDRTRRWRIGGTVAAVALTTAAGGVAWANDFGQAADPTPSPSQTASPSPSASPEDKTDRRPAKRGMFGMFGFGGALHGEFTIEKEDGKYETVATQRGEVTAVSKESVTVKSEDGFSRTYTLTEDTLVNAARDGIDDVKTGNTVHVFATVADGKATAVSLNDATVREASRDKWGLPWKPHR
jgi:predicted secreted protein